MAEVSTTRSAAPERGQERQVSLQVGQLFGVDLRPSRVFLWPGEVREGNERIISLGSPPSGLRSAHRRRFVQLGATRISYLGNPAVTVGLSAIHYMRLLAGREPRSTTPR
jgi:hypothetical protein